MTSINTNTPKTVHAPASKSVSHRMLMGAALAQGESIIRNVLESQDLMQTMAILSAAGAQFEKIDTGAYRVQGSKMIGKPDFNNPLSCDVHESGTSCRLLTAILAAGQGYFYIHGAERMHERPIGTLTSTLEALGGKFHFQKDGFPPFILYANGLKGGEVTISLEESSQYLSGLLLAAPLAKEAITIYIGGRHVVSWPYVGLTLQTMKAFGAQFDVSILDKVKSSKEKKAWKAVDWHNLKEIVPGEIRFRVRPFQKNNEQDGKSEQDEKFGYKAGNYTVEGDWSGASYLLAAGALGKNPVTVQGLNKSSLQADKALLDILKEMKARIEFGNVAEQSITIYPSHLQAIEVNMADCPDIVPTVAVLASFAHGITKITGVEHLRIKECDRLNAIAEELKKAGIHVIEEQDGLIIHGLHPDKPTSQAVLASQASQSYSNKNVEMTNKITDEIPNEITDKNIDVIAADTKNTLSPKTSSETSPKTPTEASPKEITEIDFSDKKLAFKSYGDHRIVMSLSLFELAGAQVTFDDSSVINKSFPLFWDVWKEICR